MRISNYIIYKPFQVLSQFSAVGDKQTLSDFFAVEKDVYPIGRLDYDSEGLLILSNDKKLNNLLLHPANSHNREYWVQVEGNITEQAVENLRTGVHISLEGKRYRTLPAGASLFETVPDVPSRNPPIRFRKNVADSWLKLILSEGKNRQVRKMTAAVGFPTLRLIRYRIEKLNIQNMHPGDMIKIGTSDLYKALSLSL